MGNELDIRTTGSGLAAAGGDPGPGADVNDVTFKGTAIQFADLPTRFRQRETTSTSTALVKVSHPTSALVKAGTFSPPVAPPEAGPSGVSASPLVSAARQEPKPRKSGERVVQRRVGWAVFVDRIVIVTAERPLTFTEGVYKPAGEWLLEHRQTFSVSNQLQRTGMLDPDPVTMPAGANGPAGGVATAVKGFENGEFITSFLPSPARKSILGRVPFPLLFDGNLVRVVTEGKPHRYELDLLRFDAKSAIAVRGVRVGESGPWEVTQYTYDVGDPVTEQL